MTRRSAPDDNDHMLLVMDRDLVEQLDQVLQQYTVGVPNIIIAMYRAILEHAQPAPESVVRAWQQLDGAKETQ